MIRSAGTPPRLLDLGLRGLRVALRCGDGVVAQGIEACDDGNLVQTDACLVNCEAARCGDGFVQAGAESCDDGNQVDDDGCSNTCQNAGVIPNFSGETGPLLGDGWVQCAGYLDEPGPMLSPGDDVPSRWGSACALQES